MFKKKTKPQGGAPFKLTGASLAAVEAAMVNPGRDSFSTQMHMLLPEKPEAFLFTAYSAVPVTDAVRGFYASANLEMPPANFINANSKISKRWREDVYVERVDQECERLGQFLEKFKRVCVVDQYVSTGQTLKLATAIVGASGIEVIYRLRGEWYQDAFNDEVDLANMTSNYSEAMFVIGENAFNLNP